MKIPTKRFISLFFCLSFSFSLFYFNFYYLSTGDVKFKGQTILSFSENTVQCKSTIQGKSYVVDNKGFLFYPI